MLRTAERIGVDKSTLSAVTYAYYAIFLRYTLQTIAITNQKGGSGKTTTAVNVAAALGEQGHRVLLLDLDPQASASAWLGCTNGDRGLLDGLHRQRPPYGPCTSHQRSQR